ncbi:hypothetical protein [Kordiimonas laminariae]|uniref:hypothetical protein n=1 Tax=Kordiimonas laminariae TaxID=2917717 RepID=UPI001FF47209|nr:hypothetical protein [Kordiimonas laminariae]MCK0068357.1 hypothetical protein [Kordiimonas laminariae]
MAIELWQIESDGMIEQASIIDFLSASLRGLEASGRSILSPAEQSVADEIARCLDAKLQEMVEELEAIASCQQDMPRVEGLDELPPFEAFCIGLKTIGDALLPHLVAEFSTACSEQGAPTKPFQWIIRARADAFVAYLLQIAQVHGLAFDDKLETVGKSEQIALANLGADLRLRMQQEMDKLV